MTFNLGVFRRHTAPNKKSVLLDSWSKRNSKILESIPKTKEYVKIENIPTRRAARIQPFRNIITQIQPHIHNQFSSPRFLNLTKYAWYIRGCWQEEPPD